MIKLWVVFKELHEAQMLGSTCENKFGFLPNICAQAILKLFLIIVIQTKFCKPILIYS